MYTYVFWDLFLCIHEKCLIFYFNNYFKLAFTGRTIDYGYIPPKIYNYTFHAGSTCASPDADITITDDMESEQEEAFKISIIEYTLPFGVKALGPATIIINDNDSKLFNLHIPHVLVANIYCM